MFSSIFSDEGGGGGIRRHLPSSSGLMRSTLRDTVRHLRRIRVRAGKADENDKLLIKSGDLFRDKNNEFVYEVKQVKDLIRTRNEGLRQLEDATSDFTSISQGNEIRKRTRDLNQVLNDIKVMVDDSELALGKESKKKNPKTKKLVLLERQYKERQTQYRDCAEMLELLKRMATEPVRGRSGGNGGSRPSAATKRAGEVSKKVQLLEQLNLRVLRNRQSDLTAEGGGVEMMGPVGDKSRLEDDTDTAEHMRILNHQEDEINRGLDRLRQNIGRLHEIAVEIGVQLDRQNDMLEKTDETIDKRNHDLKNLNRRLTKLLKEQAPVNTFIMVACCVIILGMIGFLLFQFNITG